MGRWLSSRKSKQRKWGSGSHRHGQGDKPKAVRHRASPARLMKLYLHLTAGQRELIEDAGFGGLLKLRCPVLPAKLCTWLLRRFDADSGELVIRAGGRRGRIPVTADSVHRVLSIPKGGRDVVYGLDEDSISFVLDKYGVSSMPSIVSLEDSIKLMKQADEHFLRTFMMIALSTFLCPNSGLKVSPRCFPSLVDISKIGELNWCQFVVEQLRKCVSSYGKKRSVGGCLFYLVILYLDSLDTRDLEIPSETPRVSVWNRELIDKVMAMDMKNDSSFGKCCLKRESKRDVNSRGTSSVSFLLGDVSAIANFVSSNVLPGYCPKNKEVLCNATTNLCSSITEALSKFMREVSGLEGGSKEAGKYSTRATTTEDNNVDNDDDLMDVDTLPDESSELATKDMEDASEDECEDESSEEGDADDSSSADSEDDPDWHSNRVTRIHSQKNTVTRNSNKSKEPRYGKNRPGEVISKGSGHDSDTPEGDERRMSQCDEENPDVEKLKSANVHEDVVAPTTTMSQARSRQQKNSEKRCSVEDKMVIQSTTLLQPGPSAMMLHDKGSMQQKNSEKRCFVEDKMAIQPASLLQPEPSAVMLYDKVSMQQKNCEKRSFVENKMVIQPAFPLPGGPSVMMLYDKGSPSKGDSNMDKAPLTDFFEGSPVIDLSTPSSSDSECTITRTVANPSSVKDLKKSS